MDKVIKNASPNWGGQRPGAGRKPTNRKPRLIRLTDEEYEKLKPFIKQIKWGGIIK